MMPIKAIRKFCLWCNCNPREVLLCSVEECPLYPLRFGKAKKGYLALKAIKRKCRDCGEGTMQAVRNCEFEGECSLYPFRMGTNPSRRGICGYPPP